MTVNSSLPQGKSVQAQTGLRIYKLRWGGSGEGKELTCVVGPQHRDVALSVLQLGLQADVDVVDQVGEQGQGEGDGRAVLLRPCERSTQTMRQDDPRKKALVLGRQDLQRAVSTLDYIRNKGSELVCHTISSKYVLKMCTAIFFAVLVSEMLVFQV